mmetsp:Transcript_133503/g.386465  ORF Transcript_133503/g.386465 Transcript_133503/m.386465 type:complete len:212 (-) Transcript_133503:2293-2928(-)
MFSFCNLFKRAIAAEQAVKHSFNSSGLATSLSSSHSAEIATTRSRQVTESWIARARRWLSNFSAWACFSTMASTASRNVSVAWKRAPICSRGNATPILNASVPCSFRISSNNFDMGPIAAFASRNAWATLRTWSTPRAFAARSISSYCSSASSTFRIRSLPVCIRQRRWTFLITFRVRSAMRPLRSPFTWLFMKTLLVPNAKCCSSSAFLS